MREDYSSAGYWERRYVTGDREGHEWYLDYATLGPLLDAWSSSSASTPPRCPAASLLVAVPGATSTIPSVRLSPRSYVPAAPRRRGSAPSPRRPRGAGGVGG